MSIKKESLAGFLVKAGLYADEKAALAVIESETETEVKLPEGTRIYSKDDWEGDGTDKKPGIEKMLQKDGIKIGKDIAVKEMKEKAGIEFEGKSQDKFIEAFKEHLLKDAGTNVDEKVKSRDKTIQELKQALETEKTEKGDIVKKYTSATKDFELLKLLPKDRDDRFSDQQYLTLLKGELEFTEEESNPVVKKKGEIVKNDKFEPVNYADAITSLFKESKWIKEDGAAGGGAAGRGGKDGIPGGSLKFSNLKEFNEALTKQDIHPGSEKASALLQSALKENPAMDLNVV